MQEVRKFPKKTKISWPYIEMANRKEEKYITIDCMKYELHTLFDSCFTTNTFEMFVGEENNVVAATLGLIILL